MSLDGQLWDAKDRVTRELTALIQRLPGIDLGNLPGSIDDLNKAWDKLTDRLVAQRDERGTEVLRLLDELAAAKQEP